MEQVLAWLDGGKFDLVVSDIAPNISGIDHIAITVTDLEAACAFYARLFGARITLARVPEASSDPEISRLTLASCASNIEAMPPGIITEAAVALATMESSPAKSKAGKTRKVPPPASALANPPMSEVAIRMSRDGSEMSGKESIVASASMGDVSDSKYSDPRVALNRIYTKTGDAGETALAGGQRVPKDAARIEAYGTVDETNATLGVGDVTIRTGGYLRLLWPGNIASNTTVTLDGILYLAATNRVTGLLLAGIPQPNGYYTSNNTPSYLAGPGVLQVGDVPTVTVTGTDAAEDAREQGDHQHGHNAIAAGLQLETPLRFQRRSQQHSQSRSLANKGSSMFISSVYAGGALGVVIGASGLFFAGFMFTAGPRWLLLPPVAARTLLWPVASIALGWLAVWVGVHVAHEVASLGLALVLQLVFASWLGWLPVSGRTSALVQ